MDVARVVLHTGATVPGLAGDGFPARRRGEGLGIMVSCAQ